MMSGGIRPHLCIAIAAIVAISSMSILLHISQEGRAYTQHAPIRIEGNGEFMVANGVTGGSGTLADPYVVEGWEIDTHSIGIEILNTDAHVVLRNIFIHSSYSDDEGEGIYLENVANARIENVVVFSKLYGIRVLTSSNITVMGSTFVDNQRCGIGIAVSTNTLIQSNTASHNGKGGDISQSLCGIGLWLSTTIDVWGNFLSDNVFGIGLWSSSQVLIGNNTIENHGTGIELYPSNDNVWIVGNNITDNDDSVSLQSSTNVHVHHNNFLNNWAPDDDNGAAENSWDDGYPSGGNFWSDYAGSDQCSGPNQDICPDPDGVGDTPFEIDSDSKDKYPLMSQTATTSPPMDTTFPLIGPLDPANGSTVDINTYTIRAWYYDPSGIDINSILLKVDGVDVTSHASIEEWVIQYTPTSPFSDALHIVHLEVSDASSNQNRATVTWSFTVDTTPPDLTPPTVADLLPPDMSVVTDARPTIGANYSDPSGIDLNVVQLVLDDTDVTDYATVTLTGVVYTPTSNLTEGDHDAYLRVRDDSLNWNLATRGWSFTIIIQDGDIDNDGLPDVWELEYFGDLDNGAYDDTDNDGLTNEEEYQLGSDPSNLDTDNDGIPDGDDSDPLVGEEKTRTVFEEVWFWAFGVAIAVVTAMVLLMWRMKKKKLEVSEPSA